MGTQYHLEWVHQSQDDYIQSVAQFTLDEPSAVQQQIQIDIFDRRWGNPLDLIKKISPTLQGIYKRVLDTRKIRNSHRIAIVNTNEIEACTGNNHLSFLHQLFNDLVKEVDVEVLLFEQENLNALLQEEKESLIEWKGQEIISFTHYGLIVKSLHF